MMNFYPWLQQTYQQITSTFLQGRGHHALLFKTDVGLGTETLIQHLVQWLLCQQKNAEAPCFQCKSCLLLQSGNHPDLHLLAPIENKDIGVDQIREMTLKLQTFAQQSGNVVVYIRGAERLTEAAANALLKTLEEPRDGVYFLLETALQAKMMATIQSRCQIWTIHAPEMSVALPWLQARCPQASEEDVMIALRLCHQRPLICKTFLENNRLPVRKAFLQTFWRFFKSRDVFLLLSTFEKEPAEVYEQLEWLESFFSDALKAKMQISEGWMNADLSQGIVQFSQQLSSAQLLKGYQILQEVQQDLREINAVNVELILASALTKLVLEVF